MRSRTAELEAVIGRWSTETIRRITAKRKTAAARGAIAVAKGERSGLEGRGRSRSTEGIGTKLKRRGLGRLRLRGSSAKAELCWLGGIVIRTEGE